MRPRGITSMLYNQDDAMVISKCIGVEIMPGLVYRSAFHGKNLADILQREEREEGSGRSLRQTKAQVEFLLGDIHDTCSSDRVMTQFFRKQRLWYALLHVQHTWCASNKESRDRTSWQGRRLPKLS